MKQKKERIVEYKGYKIEWMYRNPAEDDMRIFYFFRKGEVIVGNHISSLKEAKQIIDGITK